MTLPDTLLIEVKFTTGMAVPVPARELMALRATGDHATGLLAALFWCGDRELDGYWLVTDAADLLRQCSGGTLSVPRQDMLRAGRSQPWLAPLREHLRDKWPPFLQAFLGDALDGHESLLAGLRRRHGESALAAQLPDYRILEAEHRQAVQQIVDRHGERVAGHIFQDLLAYLVSLCGYREVTVNPVGVPDVSLTDLVGAETDNGQVHLGPFSLAEARRLVDHCRATGDNELEERIRASLPGVGNSGED